MSGQNLTLSGTGTVSSSAAEMNKVTLGSLSITDGSGGDASNYTLTGDPIH